MKLIVAAAMAAAAIAVHPSAVDRSLRADAALQHFAQVNTFGGALTSEQAMFFMAHHVDLYQLHNGKVSLFTDEQLADGQALMMQWNVDIISKLSSIATDVTGAVTAFASKASDVVTSLGNGPMAMEIRKEFASLTSPQEQAQAAAMVNTTKEPKPEDVGLLGAALAAAATANGAMDSLCEIAGCIVDPDIVSCANVPPFRTAMDFINSKFANSPTLRRIAIRVTVMPLLMFFSGLKEAAVMHLGPVGRVVDGAIKRFETACEILGAAKASGDALKTAAKDAVTCVTDRLLLAAKFTSSVLDNLKVGEFVAIVEQYDALDIGHTLSTAGVMSCIQPAIAAAQGAGGSLVDQWNSMTADKKPAGARAAKKQAKAGNAVAVGAKTGAGAGGNTAAPAATGQPQPQKQAAPSHAAPLKQGGAAPSHAAPLKQGGAAPSHAAPLKQGGAAPSHAAPLKQGGAAPSPSHKAGAVPSPSHKAGAMPSPLKRL